MKTTLLIVAAFLGLAATAQARPSDLGPSDRMKNLAHQLQKAAHHVHETAEEYAHHYGESRVLKALHRLDRQARHFHREVERYYQNPHHTEKDYRKLVRDFRKARRAMQRLHTYEHVYDDFHRVEVLIGDLAYYYRGNDHHRRNDHYRENDHYRGNDYDNGYRGRKQNRRTARGRTRISLRWRY